MDISWTIIVIVVAIAAVLYLRMRSLGYSRNHNVDTLDAMAATDSHEPVRAALEREYLKMWSDWYANKNGMKPSQLYFEPDSTWSLYNHDKDEHHINLGEWDVEELIGNGQPEFQRCADSPDWPKWKQELVHEMLHEFQYKAIDQQASSEGQRLYETYKAEFTGQGHGPEYFTAIHQVAPIFGITPEQFIEKVR